MYYKDEQVNTKARSLTLIVVTTLPFLAGHVSKSHLHISLQLLDILEI